MEDFSRVGASDAGVASHEGAAGFVVESIPVFLSAAAFGHGVEAYDWPIGELWVNAVRTVVRHTVVEFFDGGDVFLGVCGEVFLSDVGFGDVLLAGGGVFGAFGL